MASRRNQNRTRITRPALPSAALLALELQNADRVEAPGESGQFDAHLGRAQFLEQRLQRLDRLGASVEVFLQPVVGGGKMGTKVRLIAKKEIEPRRKQPQLQILAQKELLGRGEQRRFRPIEILDAYELSEVLPRFAQESAPRR